MADENLVSQGDEAIRGDGAVGFRVVCLRSNRETEIFLASMGTQPDGVVQGR